MNWFKSVAGFGILMIGISVFYYLVIYIPYRDDQKRTQEIFDKNTKDTNEQVEKEEKTSNLNGCLAQATIQYHDNWANSCVTYSQTLADGYKSCISQGLGAATCRSIWSETDPSASCSLPNDTAKRWDDIHQTAKDECFKQYK